MSTQSDDQFPHLHLPPPIKIKPTPPPPPTQAALDAAQHYIKIGRDDSTGPTTIDVFGMEIELDEYEPLEVVETLMEWHDRLALSFDAYAAPLRRTISQMGASAAQVLGALHQELERGDEDEGKVYLRMETATYKEMIGILEAMIAADPRQPE